MRTLVLSDEVCDFIDRARKEYSRFDDLWQGLEWMLAHDPYWGESRSNDWYAVKTWDWPVDGVPVIIVAYTFDEENVYIEFVLRDKA